jgi:transposase InsO family protein
MTVEEAKPTSRDAAGSRRESIARLDEEIGLLLWVLDGELSPEERREGYQRLEVLLRRKYPRAMRRPRRGNSVPPFATNKVARDSHPFFFSVLFGSSISTSLHRVYPPLALRPLKDWVVESGMIEFVGDFQSDIVIAGFIDPADSVQDTRPHCFLVREDLILTLVVASKDDDNAATVACLNDSPHAVHVVRAK